MSKICAALFSTVFILVGANSSYAEKKYDPGASDATIKIGNTESYSGPASAYAIVGRAQAAYFKMINDQGGVNGRKIEFLSYDDAYSPPKTAEQARKLIENDEVLLLYSTLGTPPNMAIIKYVNGKQVPHLFIASGGTVFGDYKKYPWSMGFQPHTEGETRVYGRYVAERYPSAKIGVLYSGDGFGRDNITGFRQGLGDKAKNIIAEVTYESTEPTVDSQLLKLRAAGVEVFANFTTPKFAAMAIRKAGEMGWKPVQILHGISISVGSVLKPAGLDHAKGVISTNYAMDVDDPAWANDEGMKKFLAFLAKFMPNEDKSSSNLVYAYMSAQAMTHVLKQCGDDLTRANVLKQAESLNKLELDLLLPGITLTTSPTDHYPIEQIQMQRFDGANWKRFGPIINID
jgi:branched-chain amino acid transport system substrate-binding protein